MIDVVVPCLVIIWAFGTLFTGVYWVAEWNYYRNWLVNMAEKTRAARYILLCWAWPLFCLMVLRQIIQDATAPDIEEEE